MCLNTELQPRNWNPEIFSAVTCFHVSECGWTRGAWEWKMIPREHRDPFLESPQNFSGRLSYSIKLVFSYVVKGRKIKITAKFRALRRLHFEDTKKSMSPEMRPNGFGTSEKWAPGPSCWTARSFALTELTNIETFRYVLTNG